MKTIKNLGLCFMLIAVMAAMAGCGKVKETNPTTTKPTTVAPTTKDGVIHDIESEVEKGIDNVKEGVDNIVDGTRETTR